MRDSITSLAFQETGCETASGDSAFARILHVNSLALLVCASANYSAFL